MDTSLVVSKVVNNCMHWVGLRDEEYGSTEYVEYM